MIKKKIFVESYVAAIHNIVVANIRKQLWLMKKISIAAPGTEEMKS